PDFSILPPSSTFAPGNNAGRFAAWSAALNASPQWHHATAFPHPQFDPNAFFLHDAGVLRLNAPVTMDEYGQLPHLGLLDNLLPDKSQHYTPLGYVLEKSGPKVQLGGDTRMDADAVLVSLNGVFGAGKGIAP